ncbi:MAG TPA: tripartite tricarboxylate transporter TctB family protein [Thermodesulfobacteriota bacterium]
MLDRPVAVVLTAAGLVYFWLASRLLVSDGPGSALFPMAVGAVWVGGAIRYLIGVWRRPAGDRRAWAEVGREVRQVTVYLLLPLACYLALLPWLGYPAATFGCAAWMIRTLSERPQHPLVPLAQGALVTGVLYLLFGGLLGVALPRAALTG